MKDTTNIDGIPQEPSADVRFLAKNLRQVYVALVDEGFETAEAIAIVGQVLTANVSLADV